ncbi:hypothetical protein ABFS83_03G107100 [Erythranthe nasuta]
MAGQGLRIHVHSHDDIRECTTPAEVWRATKPDSIVELVIPYDGDPSMRQAILDKIGDHPLVYVRDGLPGEFPPPRPAPEPRAEPELKANVWAKVISLIFLVLLIGVSNFNFEAPIIGEVPRFPCSARVLVALVLCLVALL